MKIAVAQSSAINGSVSVNIDNHLRYIREAGRLGVHYLVFPELSLTGYDLKHAKSLAFEFEDRRLKPLIEAAIQHKIAIGVGAPVQANGLPKIGLIVIRETGCMTIYEKMYLHAGEEVYFSCGDRHHFLNMGEAIIANGICADTLNPLHAKMSYKAGASIYTAGVLVTPEGYAGDSEKWASYAENYRMLVAIANYNKPSGSFMAAGKSAVWYHDQLLAQAGSTEDALVIAEKRDGLWRGSVHAM